MSIRSISFAAALAAFMQRKFFAGANAPVRPADAGAAVRAAKPYKKVAATLPPPVNDPGLDTLRKQMGEIAQRKERAALAPLIVARDSSGSAGPAMARTRRNRFG